MNIAILKADRLGNFLIQIQHAIHIALHYNYNVILPKHTFLTTTYVVLNTAITPAAKRITDETNFFSKKIFRNIDAAVVTKNNDKVITIMKSIFVYKNIPPLRNDVVIHIRSGDIFTEHPPATYIMPPLSYYKNIIEKNTYDNIYILAEDTRNPCIHRLIELYPKIHFKIQSLEKDVRMVMAAVNIVMSYGTFIPQLLNLSENVQNIYCPSYVMYRNPACTTHVTDLSEYYTSMSPWKNTQKQRKLMLEYREV